MRSLGDVILGNPQISKNDHTLMHSVEKYPTIRGVQKIDREEKK